MSERTQHTREGPSQLTPREILDIAVRRTLEDMPPHEAAFIKQVLGNMRSPRELLGDDNERHGIIRRFSRRVLELQRLLRENPEDD